VDSKVNAVVHPKVLDEVTDLVEKPLALLGRFDPAYLDIPHDVIVTAMESHQRYFPLEDERGRLLPAFAVVSNAKATGESAIVAGNERVLRARLEDAKFFFEEDMKVSLRERADKLSEVVFNRKLGTMREKVDRVKALASRVAEWTGADPETVSLAAEVCKADLLTHLVYEFPELQGSVGREYALRDKELGSRPEAAEAIREHYLPRFAGDDLPATKAGIALSLADRIDTLTGYLGVGLMPTGSEDPYALRRAATGFAVVTLTSQAAIPIDEAVSVAHDHYLRQGTELAPLEDAIRDVRGFVSGRAEGLLAQEGIDRMLVEAARTSDWTDLGDFAARARALQAAHGAGLLHPLAVAFERCHNLSKGVSGSKPDEQVFVHDAERNLYAALRRVEAPVREAAAARDYGKALEELRPLTDPVDAFFDRDRGVLVMDPDEQIRANRLALLACVASLFKQIADFSVIIPAQLELDGKT
jgi:glycyl-tRNA synthetase beta chain